jgi:Zn-dependent peptidase ImmA (M78 family)
LSFKYNRFTKRELEAAAAAFLKTNIKCSGCKVLIEEMLEAHGYDIIPVQGLYRYAEAYIPRKPGILFVDEDQQLSHPLRYRFTIAEELAHCIIHHKIFKGKSFSENREVYNSISETDYQDLERNAKFLAAALLMPRETFVERFNFHKQRIGLKTKNPVEIISLVVGSLKSEFEVSKESIGVRCKHIGLIDETCLLGLVID